MSTAFAARFAGRCVACDERIYVGDTIQMSNGGAVHNDCETAAPPDPREHPVCSVCWLTHPEGECDR